MRKGEQHGSKAQELELIEQSRYLYGRYEREIEFVEASHNFPPGSLTARIGALLLGIGQQSTQNTMPNLLQVAAELPAVARPEVEVGSRTRSASPRKKYSGKKLSGWWHKKFPTKEARSAEMLRRRKVALSKKKK